MIGVWLGMWVGATAGAAELGAWSGLRDTAGTAEAGTWVVRLPVGVSSWSATDRTEVQLQPLDLYVWAPRIAVEQVVLEDGRWTVAVRPAVAAARGGGSLRGEGLVAWATEHHRVGGSLAVDGRMLRRTTLSTTRSTEWSLERVDVPLVATWDWMPRGADGRGVLRTRVRAPLVDEGDHLGWATVTESWHQRLGRRGRVVLETGVSVLGGRPSEHVFLGDYQYPLLFAYPRIDLWVQL